MRADAHSPPVGDEPDCDRTVGLPRSCGPRRHPRLLATVAPSGGVKPDRPTARPTDSQTDRQPARPIDSQPARPTASQPDRKTGSPCHVPSRAVRAREAGASDNAAVPDAFTISRQHSLPPGARRRCVPAGVRPVRRTPPPCQHVRHRGNEGTLGTAQQTVRPPGSAFAKSRQAVPHRITRGRNRPAAQVDGSGGPDTGPTTALHCAAAGFRLAPEHGIRRTSARGDGGRIGPASGRGVRLVGRRHARRQRPG